MKKLVKAIFLDRDGTLNEDKGYVHKVEDFALLPGVIEGLKLLKNEFIFIIITNQSGIGRGYYTVDDLHAFNKLLIEALDKEAIEIKKLFFCPHIPEDKCECRKPNTHFIDLSTNEYNIDLKNSWVIGDHPSDASLGINAGCNTAYLLTGHGPEHYEELEEKNINPTIIAKDFLSAAKKILEFL
ncbi:MAG: HAD-IIIA family hydrolase [Promethearchaeota archaeon]|nr:MAG: HAD-IIIA family hydrolase [Candidatus Lokiarchaeota archaeon]